MSMMASGAFDVPVGGASPLSSSVVQCGHAGFFFDDARCSHAMCAQWAIERVKECRENCEAIQTVIDYQTKSHFCVCNLRRDDGLDRTVQRIQRFAHA